MDKRKKKKVLPILSAICFILGVLILVLTRFSKQKFVISFESLLYTVSTPMKGVGGGFWTDMIWYVVPPVLIALALLILGYVLFSTPKFRAWAGRKLEKLKKNTKARNTIRKALIASGFLFLLVSVILAMHYLFIDLGGLEYMTSRDEGTPVYEESYVDPKTVKVKAPAKKPNVIWLVLESMETTYASEEDGGAQEENYIPNLTRLARENISFSESETLGGFYALDNTNWTMAALFAGTSGLPFGFPVERNAMSKSESFAEDATAIGDILKRDGYTNEFICGSDAEFGGRALYFRQHGDYIIYDLFTAREQGDIEPDYYVFWGFEDRILFRIAKKEATRLWEAGEPFNLTILTVDAHHFGGYTCEECGTEFDDRTANVIACTDRQVNEFIDWCREQPFWGNTVIVMTGDHPRMDTPLVGDVPYTERTVYNCFINARKTPRGGTTGRLSTMMDMYPTILSAMGYTIQGNRLGLGTDLFSTRETLAEEMGYEELNSELKKSIGFFVENFMDEPEETEEPEGDAS